MGHGNRGIGDRIAGPVWWALVVLPQRGKARTLKQPSLDVDAHVKQPA